MAPIIRRCTTKQVEMSPTAYEWLSSHRFVSEETIIGIVINTPSSERKYLDDGSFTITFKRRKNSKFVNVILWIDERSTTFFVYKIHSQESDVTANYLDLV